METHSVSSEDIQTIYNDKSRYLIIARSYVRDNAVAEDIFHDGLLFLLEKRGLLEIGDIRPYFARMVVSRCINHLRQSSRQGAIRDSIRDAVLESESVDINSGRSGDRFALLSEMEDRLKECRRSLTPLSFNIFLASRISGLSHREIAEEFGITQRRVNTEIQKALAVFRSEFRDYLLFPALLPFLVMAAMEMGSIA